MRTRFLIDLDVEGGAQVTEQLPNFDFYDLKRVSSFRWNSENESEEFPTLEVIFEYAVDEVSRAKVQICFVGVSRCVLPELGKYFWCSEIEVEDVTQCQLEDVRYVMKDYHSSNFEVHCKRLFIELISN
jgi:hypothetical protein